MVRDVLAAALQAFVEFGYAGLSIEDVARRAGVNKTTVYRRWPTRAALARAALLSLRDDEPPTPDTGSLREDLYRLLRARAARLRTKERRAIFQAMLLGADDPELQKVVARLKRERPLIPKEVIARAIRRGELRAGTDARLLADVLLGTLHSRIYWRRETVTDAFVRALVDLVASGAARVES